MYREHQLNRNRQAGDNEVGSRNSGRSERRIRYSEDLLWGIHPVLEALQTYPEKITELILQKDKRSGSREELLDLAKKNGIKYSFAERIKITGSSGGQIRHQGVVAKGASVSLIPFDDFLATFSSAITQGGLPKIIVCDSIQDPHNIGAIIRSAHAAGVFQVLLTRERSAPLGGTAAKASAGTISRVQISQVTNLVNALKALKKAGAWIFGAVKEDSALSIYQTDFNVPACIVVGNEGQGIRPLVRRNCDFLISIPMVGALDSLNSSVASGVIMFEMLRQQLAVLPGKAEYSEVNPLDAVQD